ncbi:protein of unknown function [Serratia sp. Tan611]|nr:protein of unknown function [Serratia sp. Tan611]
MWEMKQCFIFKVNTDIVFSPLPYNKNVYPHNIFYDAYCPKTYRPVTTCSIFLKCLPRTTATVRLLLSHNYIPSY